MRETMRNSTVIASSNDNSAPTCICRSAIAWLVGDFVAMRVARPGGELGAGGGSQRGLDREPTSACAKAASRSVAASRKQRRGRRRRGEFGDDRVGRSPGRSSAPRSVGKPRAGDKSVRETERRHVGGRRRAARQREIGRRCDAEGAAGA